MRKTIQSGKNSSVTLTEQQNEMDYLLAELEEIYDDEVDFYD